MATKKKPELDGDAIAKAISKDLPGWDIARKRPVSDAAMSGTLSKAQPATTIRDLRKKFLGKDSESDADSDSDASGDDAREDYGELSKDRTTVEVEPKAGGAAKVADVVKGKAKIVQG